tara:strand:- start:2011 stop:2664 length:654 start_codon:yes stop_codon:yes gene_type:complete
MRSKRTRRLNKKYRRSQKIGKKTKRGKKKKSRRVKKIIHRGGMFSDEYEGLPGVEKSVSTGRLPPLYGKHRDPAGTTHDTPRADVKADTTQGDKSKLDELMERRMVSGTTFSDDSSPQTDDKTGVARNKRLQQKLTTMEKSIHELQARQPDLNDIDQCYWKKPGSQRDCGSYPDAKDPLYLSTAGSYVGLTTTPRDWSKYSELTTDGRWNYCCKPKT